jgi:hypothetical protein
MSVTESGFPGRTVSPVKLMRNGSAGTDGKDRELEWLFHPSLTWESRVNNARDNSPEEVRVSVGDHEYWVRVSRETPELCRTGRKSGNLVHHEVLNHQSFGVTDDDLDEILRHTCYPFARDFRISERVKTKLQALHEP